MRLHLIFLTLLLALPAKFSASIQSHEPWMGHYAGVSTLWGRYLGSAPPTEAKFFSIETYRGTGGNLYLCQYLAAISIMECDHDLRKRMRFGRLGGHRETILKGSKELGDGMSWAWIEKNPWYKTRCLAKRFSVIHRINSKRWHPPLVTPIEKTCRQWVKGQNWHTTDAKNYWRGVQKFVVVYGSK